MAELPKPGQVWGDWNEPKKCRFVQEVNDSYSLVAYMLFGFHANIESFEEWAAWASSAYLITEQPDEQK